ncbi:MAG: hypothetical protein ABJF23_22705 [Bryobacteraceae bacterium]
MTARWFVSILFLATIPVRTMDALTTHLVIDDSLIRAIDQEVLSEFHVIAKSSLNAETLVDALAHGDNCIWISDPTGLPPDLWAGSFRPAKTPLEISTVGSSPIIVSKLPFRKALVSSIYIKPVTDMPNHNVDEEQRANLEPILEARDRFGRVIGYPGALMRYYAPSLVRHRFSGSECFLFLFDKPAEAMAPADWSALLKAIAIRTTGAVRFTRASSDYASYRMGERARISARLRNSAREAHATEVHFSLKGPQDKEFRLIDRQRRIPDGESESDASIDVLLRGEPGLWTFRVELLKDPNQSRFPAIEGHPIPIDRMEIGVVVENAGPLTTAANFRVDGPNILIDNKPGFWAGTNYYPSSSWWEWLWNDFRPLQANEDFAAMRRAGYRIVRVWVDPILDEQALRAIDAAIYLAAKNGIVLDVCVFTQWVRTIGFERPNGERVRFDFRRPIDFNVYGISFRNLDLQREYIGVLARRWRNVGNLIYNLSNETYVKDPDQGQMDAEAAQWKGIPPANGELRDSLLFQRWSDEMTLAIRKAGAAQPVMPGDLFSLMGGGDAYIGNRHGALASWHSYSSPANTAATLSYFNPACSGRPQLLEEFGTRGWNHAAEYDGATHAALGSGAAAAMSYEWGVRWLAPEQSFAASPLREILDNPPDPRWFAPVIDIAKKWPKQVPGLNFSPSGFFYGSIYSGTPFPAEAAVALGRLGLMGGRLAPTAYDGPVYVVIPSAASAKTTGDVVRAIEHLQREKIEFGILQEDCLQSPLPKTARALIVPADLAPSTVERLKVFTRSRVRVLTTSQDLELPRVRVEVEGRAGSAIDTLVRRTARGSLYTLMTDRPPAPVKLTLPHDPVTFDLNKYGVVEAGSNGITFIEAAGEVGIGGKPVFGVKSGRALIDSDDGLPLDRSARIRIMTT